MTNPKICCKKFCGVIFFGRKIEVPKIAALLFALDEHARIATR